VAAELEGLTPSPVFYNKGYLMESQ